MLNRTLVLPSQAAVSAANPSLRLVGVSVHGTPTPQRWQVTIYYSGNQTFINGTTTIKDLMATNGIYITEDPVPLGVNSSQVAHDAFTPPLVTICRTISAPSTNSSSSTIQCQTSTGTGGTAGDYIVVQNGLSILVNPTANLSWADGRRGISVGLGSANLSIAQLLIIASTMTSPPAG
jgi:hypothetical protein